MESVIQDKRECFFCGRQTGLHVHHIYGGTANRKISDRLGYTVFLCADHHTGNDGVHRRRDMDLMLKRQAQEHFERDHSRTEFIKTFGRSYL